MDDLLKGYETRGRESLVQMVIIYMQKNTFFTKRTDLC